MQTISSTSVTWFEIPTSNMEKAKSFYSELLGWGYQEFHVNSSESFWMVMEGDRPTGGLREVSSKSSSNSSSGPIMYFTVSSVDSTLVKAKSMGAKVLQEKVCIPEEGGFYAHIQDQDGNTIGIWSAEA